MAWSACSPVATRLARHQKGRNAIIITTHRQNHCQHYHLLVMTQFQNENNAVSCARSKDLLQEIWGKSSSAGTIITLMLWILRITYCPTRFRSRIFIKSFIQLMILSSLDPSSHHRHVLGWKLFCPWMEAVSVALKTSWSWCSHNRPFMSTQLFYAR